MYEVTALTLASGLIVSFSYVFYYSLGNTCGFCMKSICGSFLFSNLFRVAAVQTVWPLSQEGALISDSLSEMTMNVAYSFLVLRYLFVVRGNRYVLKGQAVPDRIRKSNMGMMHLNMVLNVSAPIAFIICVSKVSV